MTHLWVPFHSFRTTALITAYSPGEAAFQILLLAKINLIIIIAPYYPIQQHLRISVA